jgi:hypothetical protein
MVSPDLALQLRALATHASAANFSCVYTGWRLMQGQCDRLEISPKSEDSELSRSSLREVVQYDSPQRLQVDRVLGVHLRASGKRKSVVLISKANANHNHSNGTDADVRAELDLLFWILKSLTKHKDQHTAGTINSPFEDFDANRHLYRRTN